MKGKQRPAWLTGLCALALVAWHPAGLHAAEVPAGWKTMEFLGFGFAVPPDWETLKKKDHELVVGKIDRAARKGVTFTATLESHPERTARDAAKSGATVSELGEIRLGGELAAKQLEISGNMEGTPVYMRSLQLVEPNADGDYRLFGGGVIGADDVEARKTTVGQILDTVHPLAEAIQELSGYREESALDGLFTLSVRGNWKAEDFAGDTMYWQPPEVRRYGLRIGVSREILIFDAKGLVLRYPAPPRTERSSVAGEPAVLYDGMTEDAEPVRDFDINTATTTPPDNTPSFARKQVYLLDRCLPKGDRLLVHVTGTQRRRTQYAAALEKSLASLKINLPAGSTACDELTPRTWQQVSLGLPRAWRRNESKEHRDWDDWRGFDAMARAKVKFQILNDSPKPPDQRDGAPLEKVGPVTISGRPASVYQRIEQDGSRPEIVRVYSLDEPVVRGNMPPRYLDFSFTYEPESATAALTVPEQEIIAAIQVPDGWLATTPAPPASGTTPSTAAAPGAKGGGALSVAEQEALAKALFDKIRAADDYDVATIERLYREVMDKCPDTAKAEESYWRLSNMYMLAYDEPQREPARDLLERFLARYPDSELLPAAKQRLVRIYEELGAWDKVVAMYGAVLEKDDVAPEVVAEIGFSYAEALHKSGQGEAARRWYQRFLETVKDSDDLRSRAAEQALRELEGAPAAGAGAPASTPQQQAAQAQQAGAELQGKGDYLGALQAYRKSLAVKPDALLADRVKRLETYLKLKGIEVPPGQ